MAGRDARIAQWYGWVVDVLCQSLTQMPVRAVLDELRQTFDLTIASYNWSEPDGSFGMSVVPADLLLNEPETFDQWLTGEFFDCHPLMTWYVRTGDPRPQTAARVPRDLVPAHRRLIVERPLRRLGVEQQLTMIYRLGPGMQRAFVVGRGGRDFDDDDLVVAAGVQRGLRCLDAQSGVLHRAVSPLAAPRISAAGVLSGRESAVLQLLGEGVTVRETGRRLGCTPRTVEKHLEHSYRKLGVRDRLNAVRLAGELGLIARPAPPDVAMPDDLPGWRGPVRARS